MDILLTYNLVGRCFLILGSDNSVLSSYYCHLLAISLVERIHVLFCALDPVVQVSSLAFDSCLDVVLHLSGYTANHPQPSTLSLD